jgi:pre-60S factor REI1
MDVADCAICKKSFKSEGSYQQHLVSKKHKEAVAEAEKRGAEGLLTAKSPVPAHIRAALDGNNADAATATATVTDAPADGEKKELTEEEIMQQRIENAIKLSPEDCLFCRNKSVDFEANMAHMTRAHSFFIPDIEYMKDLRGFIHYLGEKVSVGLTCLSCNGVGRGFHSLEAVQSHMRDLSHCRLAYDDNEDEYADFYDFDRMDEDKGAPERPAAVDSSSGELMLANNKVLGHRENRVYFKQRAKPKDSQLILSLAKEYRIMAAKREQMAKYPSRPHMDHEKDHLLHIGIQNNNMKHYRHQNPK